MSENEMIETKLKYGEMFDYDYFPNEPDGKLTEKDIHELYKKCIKEGKPWQHYIKPEDDTGKIL